MGKGSHKAVLEQWNVVSMAGEECECASEGQVGRWGGQSEDALETQLEQGVSWVRHFSSR